jgi:hypothetical protein
MTQPQLVEIQGILTAKHAMDWPKGPLTDLELLYALGKVIKDALREGEKIGINETSANAQRQFAQMQKPAVLWPAG